MQIFEEIFEIEMEMWGDGKMRMGTYDHTTIANIPLKLWRMPYPPTKIGEEILLGNLSNNLNSKSYGNI